MRSSITVWKHRLPTIHYIKRNPNWKFVAVYSDVASGVRTANHSGYQQLMRDWTWDGLCSEIGTDEASIFYRELIRYAELSKDRYCAVLKPLGAHYNVFTVKGLPDEYVEILIGLGIIAVTAENVKFMRTSYPNQVVNFLMQDKCGKFADMVERGEANLEKTELILLLEDKRLRDGTAVRLLEFHDAALPVAGKNVLGQYK